jgi:hypothetical protein
VSGVDVSTMSFDENQLTITPDIIGPGTFERVHQLFDDDPNADTIGPIKPTGDNVRSTKTRDLA